MPTPLVYGLIGWPVRHSLSPSMHNAAFKALGIDAQYRLFEVRPENLERFLLGEGAASDATGASFDSGGVAGFNVTIPHKIRAKEIIEQHYGSAGKAAESDALLYHVQLSGAVNTIKRGGSTSLQYRNTDAAGFLRSLAEDLSFTATKGASVLVIGCGGAGRAVIAALSWKELGVGMIYCFDTNPNAMHAAIKHFSAFASIGPRLSFIGQNELNEVVSRCSLLVNASPVGMKEEDLCPVAHETLHKGLSVYDVVYNRTTALVSAARAAGCPAVTGAGMLLYQGVAAFEFWTGRKAPLEVMRQALYRELKQ